jgi:hypothetical protein
MAGKLCYLAVCEGDIEPSITCGYDIGDVINLKAGLLEYASHNLIGELPMLWTGGTLDRRKYIVALVQEHDFGQGGTYVNTGEVQEASWRLATG